jgi:F0F1-type ATP synthase assembly protein I
MRERSRTRLAIVGAVIGVAVGVLVSVTTDIPLAPELGLLLGAVAGWFSATDSACLLADVPQGMHKEEARRSSLDPSR